MPTGRFALDARLTYYTHGGIAHYTRRLIEALQVIDAENDYSILQSRKQREALANRPNFRRVSCWTPSHHRFERWALAAEIAPLRLDVLHSPDFIPPAYGARAFVITVHDLNFMRAPERLTEASQRYYRGQIASAVQRADQIIAVSQATCADLVAYTGVSPHKLHVIPEAADRAFRPLSPDEAATILSRYDLTPGYILFVGTLEPRKNLPGLLRAYHRLINEHRLDPPLVLVGRRGWLDEDMAAVQHELGLSEQVHHLEAVRDDDLPALYNGAALHILPSFDEGFGLPALEAMACGTPTVVSDRGALPETVSDAGLQVDPYDVEALAAAIARGLSDTDLRAHMRARGLAKAATYSWEATARQTIAVYQLSIQSAP
jgi:glycosyltransferase involved in cell wall biosynthesis